jgi:hypothetical protein
LTAGSYAGALPSLWCLRVQDLNPHERPDRTPDVLMAAFRYVAKRPDLLVVLVMLLLMGTFGVNFGDLHFDNVDHGVRRRRLPVRRTHLGHGDGRC